MQENKTEVAEYKPIEASLAALRHKYQAVVFQVNTKEGDKEAREARRELVGLRTSLEEKRAELKKPVLELGRAIDAEAKRITAEIEALEKPIDEQIKAEEKRKADERAAREAAEKAEREAREKAEKARIDAIRTKIKAITDKPLEVLGKKPLDIENAINQVEFMPVTDVEFEEFVIEASEARETAVSKLREMHAAAVHQEEEDKRLAAEREQLEQQRRAQEAELEAKRQELERQRQEQEAREAEQRRQQEAAESEARRVREEAERIENEHRELEARREAQERREREAAARKEAEAAEARQREIEKAETLRMDAQQMLNTFAARYGHLEEFAGVNAAIAAYFEQLKVAA